MSLVGLTPYRKQGQPLPQGIRGKSLCSPMPQCEHLSMHITMPSLHPRCCCEDGRSNNSEGPANPRWLDQVLGHASGCHENVANFQESVPRPGIPEAGIPLGSGLQAPVCSQD